MLLLRVRRFTCDDASCERRTFVEQITGLARRHSQRTERMRSVLADVGLALAGRAGARLADVFGASASRNIVEGHVNRIKMIKRQIHGRACIDLLRKRVLLA